MYFYNSGAQSKALLVWSFDSNLFPWNNKINEAHYLKGRDWCKTKEWFFNIDSLTIIFIKNYVNTRILFHSVLMLFRVGQSYDKNYFELINASLAEIFGFTHIDGSFVTLDFIYWLKQILQYFFLFLLTCACVVVFTGADILNGTAWSTTKTNPRIIFSYVIDVILFYLSIA